MGGEVRVSLLTCQNVRMSWVKCGGISADALLSKDLFPTPGRSYPMLVVLYIREVAPKMPPQHSGWRNYNSICLDGTFPRNWYLKPRNIETLKVRKMKFWISFRKMMFSFQLWSFIGLASTGGRNFVQQKQLGGPSSWGAVSMVPYGSVTSGVVPFNRC